MPPSAADRTVKQERLAAVRAAAGGSPVVLRSHEAIAWYLDGVRTHVSLAGAPVLAVRVGVDGDELFVADNEADRLVAEELLPADAARIVRVPWQTPPAQAAAARGGLDEDAVAPAMRAARAALLPAETARYRVLGLQTAQALTEVAETLAADTTERDAAASLAHALTVRGIDPLVVLVAGVKRLPFRHPLPTAAPLRTRAMLVVCGRRHGLIANATRWVGDAGVDDERILRVEAAWLSATRPGAALGEVFQAGCAAYADAGFPADEWRRHHQGGPTGYAGRDPRATAEVPDLVCDGQAFAWNPTAPGAKVEDTMLVTASGIEVLTADPRWPSIEHAGLARPAARAFS